MEGGGGVSTAAPALAAVPATARRRVSKRSARRAQARWAPVSVDSLSCSSRCRMCSLPFLFSTRRQVLLAEPRFSVVVAASPVAARMGGFDSSDELLARGFGIAAQERQRGVPVGCAELV